MCKIVKIKQSGVHSLILVVAFTLAFPFVCRADVPAPPANQTVGTDDGIFNNIVEADCRACHDDPDVSGATPNVDRHHLLYGQPLPEGECSVNSNACLSDANCDSGICSSSGATCSDDADCPDFALGETCGEVCIGETVAPNIDVSPDVYSCLTCHEQDTSGGDIDFLIERDCLKCHVQIPGEGSVHHLTAVAQGNDSPLGDPDVGDCTPCHGTLVDDIGDGHAMPTYAPTSMTPSPTGGGFPGACDYCHDTGTDIDTGIEVFNNADTHHNTGIFTSETGVYNSVACMWCHNISLPAAYDIRTCEGCHGLDSLHNIAIDSDTECLMDPATPDCEVIVGGEDAGYSHVGNDSDCQGCHNASSSRLRVRAAASSDYGSVTPYIKGSDVRVMTSGTDTQFMLTGAAFTNVMGSFRWTSDVVLTDEGRSSMTLTPDIITQGALTITIPGTIAPGNYSLKAVKSVDAVSNPVVISVKPEVVITAITHSKCLGIVEITGAGFGDAPPEGAEDYINVEKDGVPMTIQSWTDKKIRAYGSISRGKVEVNGLFGSDSYELR